MDKKECLIHTYSDTGFKDTVVNQKWPTLNGESLEITCTVPLCLIEKYWVR